MFGIALAPEKYKQIIRNLRDCEGVTNIADDLIILGRDVLEHDKRLFAVLDRLREKGLTPINTKKRVPLVSINLFWT